MASLTAHLRRPDDHGRLSFHPECPICRQERLIGTLADGAIVSPRSQALLAAGVLALSSAAPTAVFAGEPEQEQEGTTAPEQITGNDPSDAPEFDAGGQPTQLPLDAGPAPEDSGAFDPTDEQTPPAQQPAVNENVPAPPVQEPATDEPAADGTAEAGTPSAREQQEPPAADPVEQAAEQPPPPAPPATESPAPTPSPDAPAAELQQTAPAAAQTDASAKARAREHEATSEARQQARHAAPAPPNSATAPANAPATAPAPAYTPTTAPARTYTSPPAPQPEPVNVASTTTTTSEPAAPQPAQTPPAGAHHHGAAHPANGFHTVQRGESLWSIARDLVGDGASAARIAREVNRLWELNSERIGTGEPDLIMAGTRIALR
jgi:hypothetical protein